MHEIVGIVCIILYRKMSKKVIMYMIVAVLMTVCYSCKENEYKSVQEEEQTAGYRDCVPEVADKYAYLVAPDSEEWKNLNSETETIRACQLPEDALKSISTPGLIRSFWDMPTGWRNFILSSHSSPIVRSNCVYQYSNIIEELNERKDAGVSLFYFYCEIGFDCWSLMTVDEQINFCLKFAVFNVLFTQQKILEHLDPKVVVAAIYEKYEQMQNLKNEVFLDYSSVDVMAHVMYMSNYLPVVEYFDSKENLLVTADRVDYVISFVKNFIR